MIKISKEEVLKIAEMARISIHESEIEEIQSKLELVLSYAERVQKVAEDFDVSAQSNKCVNIFRQDIVAKTDPEPILEQAVCREENYFVVPVIIENK
ncbi:MAG: Aspartyl/glutamyl-tRNA(Asn/Gln) amidotransferase subunit C [candidate division TM6 bacterium GW2011_GWF2_30_66]|jgi:aspartyl-tRNA(Asn)/glutamyl-tRNA(Gln) amidotransferase subunit C|nr:MAG: Aspartyl/glutamyl-tRNA(Asn/Gln) amidotransferase subunit C [candidate division TM6 bacterium GW2011_GWF2_30_66]